MSKIDWRSWLAALTLVGAASAQQAGEEIPRQADARAQIRYAAGVRREGKGLKGDDRIDHLKRVAAAYEAVGRHFASSKAECAEASFRLGETRRSMGDREGAIGAFEEVVSNASSRRFSARALLEIGHLYRRSKEGTKALEAYARVIAEFPEEKGYRDDAYDWIGRVNAGARNHEAARSAWMKVAEQGEDPVDRIRAFDRVAGSYIVEGKNVEAGAAIERCRSLFAELAEESTSRGARVKKALGGMKSAAKLADALAKGQGEDGPDDDGDGPGQ